MINVFKKIKDDKIKVSYFWLIQKEDNNVNIVMYSYNYENFAKRDLFYTPNETLESCWKNKILGKRILSEDFKFDKFSKYPAGRIDYCESDDSYYIFTSQYILSRYYLKRKISRKLNVKKDLKFKLESSFNNFEVCFEGI